VAPKGARSPRAAYHPAMASPTELPSHVQRIVDEIETEIGEDPQWSRASIEGALGRDDLDGGPNGVEAAVRQILVEIGEDPTP